MLISSVLLFQSELKTHFNVILLIFLHRYYVISEMYEEIMIMTYAKLALMKINEIVKCLTIDFFLLTENHEWYLINKYIRISRLLFCQWG